MFSSNKRATLSSGLLGAKPAAPEGETDTSPPARLGLERAAMRSTIGTGGAGGAERQAEPAAQDENMLYSKGAASASSFRPWYWSYNRQAEAPEAAVRKADAPDTARASVVRALRVGPAGADETAAPPRGSRSPAIMMTVGIVALVVSGGLFAVTQWPRAPDETAAQSTLIPLDRAKPAVPTAPTLAREPAVVAVPAPAPAPASASAPAAPLQEPAAAPPSAHAGATAMPAAPQDAALPPAGTQAKPTPPQDIEALIERGNQLVATGDIAAARFFYQRSAEQGSGPAATAVGKTYDPLFLEQARVRGVRGDPAMAAEWYRKAISAGDHQAERRLKQLTGKSPG